jgi:hypothetical protein
MAKRNKGSKVQKRAKLRRGNPAKRRKTRKVAKSARGGTTRTVAKAKPKRAPLKKAARRTKEPVAPVVETVEHPAPEFEEVSQVSPGPDEPEEC